MDEVFFMGVGFFLVLGLIFYWLDWDSSIGRRYNVNDKAPISVI